MARTPKLVAENVRDWSPEGLVGLKATEAGVHEYAY